jgi:hypothetical protein
VLCLVPLVQKDAKVPAPRVRRGLFWLLLPAIAIVEIAGHGVVRSRVVGDDDWARAAERVRSEWRTGDLIVAAPEWADPLVRRELGDLITLEDAGRADTAQYDRLWALSIRGHRPAEAPDGAPELSEQVGSVRILRWNLPLGGVLYDFVEHVPEARVSMMSGGRPRNCRWQHSRAMGGGLGWGAIVPEYRHSCDSGRTAWVGATVQDTLDLRPRYCVWQHPAGAEPVRATFPSVPLGDRIVFYGDLYYEDERHLDHGPIDVVIRIEDEEIGRMTHRDGDGWKRIEASTEWPMRRGRDRADVTIEVSASAAEKRSFCWAATTRGEVP